MCIWWTVLYYTLKILLIGWILCYVVFITMKNCDKIIDKMNFFKGTAFYNQEPFLRVMFHLDEVTFSRACVVFGFYCIMMKVPSNVQVSGFRWKTQHIKNELLFKQYTWCTQYFIIYIFSKNDLESYWWLHVFTDPMENGKTESLGFGWVTEMEDRINRWTEMRWSMVEVSWDPVWFIWPVTPSDLTVWTVRAVFSPFSRQLGIT